MYTLILYEPDHQAISIAPERIELPLPLSNVIADDKKKSKRKTNNDEKKLIFGRAEPSESELDDRIQLIAKAQGKDIISRTHFSISYNTDEQSYEVQDLGSTNGVYVNGVRIARCYLMHNDILQIGGVNTNIIAVGQCLPEECSTMSCIKYKFNDDNLVNKSKHSITNKSIPLKVSISTTDSNIQSTKKINATKTKNENKEIDNKNEQRELDLIKSELYQKHQHDNLTRELKQEKRRLEGEVNELKSKLVKYENSKTTGTIDKSEISSSVECPLCADVILNAAILSCSHGYCMSCIESYWRKDETNKVARLQRKVSKKGVSTCPVCADNIEPEPDKTSKGPNDKSISFEHLYHRSLQLDSICSLLYDDRDILKERERRCREILTCYGVNVDRSRSLKSDNDYEEEMKADDNQPRGNKNDPLCILCGNYHDAFVPCALNDETEGDDDDDEDDEDDDDGEDD